MWRSHLGIIWRLFFLQSSRNERTIDGLGFYHVLSPILRKLSQGVEETRDMAERHMGYFNTNTALSSFVVGVVANLEKRRKVEANVTAERIERAKSTLSSVLTARGDYFFEVVLVPLGLTIGSIFAIYSSYIGLLIFLVLYNYYHFQLRVGGYLKSLTMGEGVGLELVTHLFREQGLLGGCAAFASGVFAALVFTRAFERGGLRFAGWGLVAVAAVVLLRSRLSFFWGVFVVLLATALYLIVL